MPKLNCIKILALLATSLGAQTGVVLPAANLWVNNTVGSDSNTGSFSAPFATVSHAMGVATSGQLIAVYGGPGPSYNSGLNCVGQLRYPESVTMAAGVALLGYGGCPSYFDCADPVSSGAWSKSAGYINLYQATVTTANQAGTGFLCVWENGVCGPNFPYVSTLAALDSATNGYYVANQFGISGTSQTIYVHATGSGNPASNGNLYEYTNRAQGINSSVSGSVIANVQCGRQQSNNGCFEADSNAFVSNITALYGTKHNALLGGGVTGNNLLIANSYYAGGSKNQLVIFASNPNGADVTLNNLVTINTVESGGAVFGHTNAGEFGSITLNNPNLGAGTGGYSGVYAAKQILTGGSIANALVVNGTLDVVSGVTITGQVTIGGTVTIANSTIIGTFVNGCIRGGGGTNLTVSGTTLSNATAFDGAFYFDSAPASINIQNNTFLAPVQTNYVQGTGTMGIGSVVYDYNVYHYPTGGHSWQNLSGSSYDFSSTGWASWQALGYDVHGSRVTP